MAIFGSKKKEEKKKKAPAAKKPAVNDTASQKAAPKTQSRDVLVRPHVTEKAAQATARNVYTFSVRNDATKVSIARAIQDVYRVKPVKVNIVKTPGKRVRLRTRRGYGSRSAAKKAYVYLKDGDRIEFAS